jgi:hypothetical protein
MRWVIAGFLSLETSLFVMSIYVIVVTALILSPANR